MGACLSGGSGGAVVVESADGGEEDFHNRFLEDRVLGEGEFGVVKLVHDMRQNGDGDDNNNNNDYACKTLRKGVVFKDNVLYTPLKPEVLRGEVHMLKTLDGQHYCLGLRAVYETPKLIWIVTEFCSGGELIDYVAGQADVVAVDVARMAFQMLDAIAHCARHQIVHRDIKPQNVMFLTQDPGSDLRLIDFGSGTHKPLAAPGGKPSSAEEQAAMLPDHHTTFAGSAFYISPEMFQRNYTSKTDVWSVGVTLYVLVAGYPADILQTAFDTMQTAKRDLKKLPNMPDDLPESFYDLLEKLLVYRHKQRPAAADLLDHEFLQLREATLSVDDIAKDAATTNAAAAAGTNTHRRTLRNSVGRHSLFLDYRKFERSLTTLLATMLNKTELAALLAAIQMQAAEKDVEVAFQDDEEGTEKPNAKQLDILRVHELKELLEAQQRKEVLEMIDQLPNSQMYNNYAYQVTLLKEFARSDGAAAGRLSTSSQRGGRRRRASHRLNRSLRGSFRRRSVAGGGGSARNLDTSVHSAGNASQRSAGGVYKEWVAQGLIKDKGTVS